MSSDIYIIIIAVLFTVLSCKEDKNAALSSNQSLEYDQLSLSELKGKDDMIETGPQVWSILPKEDVYESRLIVDPENYISIGSPFSAFIEEIHIRQGQKIRKGDLLFILKNPEIYELQSEYLETRERIGYYEQEFRRKGELSLDHAASMRSFQIAESDYRSMLSRLQAYEKRLDYLGITPDSLITSGMVDDIRLFAPFSATVLACVAETGKYVSAGDRLSELARLDNLIAESSVNIMRSDIFLKGGEIYFTPVHADSITVPVVLSYSSPVAGKDQGLLMGFRIENHEEFLIPGMKGWLSSAKPEPSLLVPVEAAISIDNVRYIFIVSDNSYKRVRIYQGLEYNGMIEILNNEIISHDDPIVYKGAEILQEELLKRSVSLK